MKILTQNSFSVFYIFRFERYLAKKLLYWKKLFTISKRVSGEKIGILVELYSDARNHSNHIASKVLALVAWFVLKKVVYGPYL
jgi:hypothetical protein